MARQFVSFPEKFLKAHVKDGKTEDPDVHFLYCLAWRQSDVRCIFGPAIVLLFTAFVPIYREEVAD